MKEAASTLADLIGPKMSPAQSSNQDLLKGKSYYLLFLSASMSDKEIDSSLRGIVGRPDALAVFRGVLPGETIGQGISRIHGYLRDYKETEIPNVILDPTKFQLAGIDTVPAMAYISNESVQIKVRGLNNIDWITDRKAAGEKGDLGQYGPTKEIAEPDLIEVMKERAAAIDWETKKKAAQERYWKHQNYIRLPAVQEYRERRIDPTVVAVRDIKDEKGNVLIFKGHRFNPMKSVPFNQLLIIFNGRDPDQVQKAKELRKESTEFQPVTFITTEVDTERGWDHMREIELELKAPVYKLSPEIVTRFHISAVPTTVTGKDERFLVIEHPFKEQSGSTLQTTAQSNQ